jgi:polynucleotide 5'-kinase involved in rRNA processing
MLGQLQFLMRKESAKHTEVMKRLEKADSEARFEELKLLCDKYRRKDGYYNCVIAVVGGKDSHFLTYLINAKIADLHKLFFPLG